MAFIDTSDLAEANSFQRKLVPCVAKVAGAVLVEVPSRKHVMDTKRNELARRVLSDPVITSKEFIWGVLSNSVIATAGIAATDGDIEFQVTQMWSTIAGVTQAEQNEVPAPIPV